MNDFLLLNLRSRLLHNSYVYILNFQFRDKIKILQKYLIAIMYLSFVQHLFNI